MVKNKFGGFKGKTFARKLAKPTSTIVRLPEDDELEHFGCVCRLLGNNRVLVKLTNGKEMQCVIRNKFRGRSKRNNLITIGSFVLIGLYELEKPNYKNADILSVYSYEDVLYLKSLPQYNLSSLDSFLYNLNPEKKTDNMIEFTTEDYELPPSKAAIMEDLPPSVEDVDINIDEI
jgi:translation initiation factor IF-1